MEQSKLIKDYYATASVLGNVALAQKLVDNLYHLNVVAFNFSRWAYLMSRALSVTLPAASCPSTTPGQPLSSAHSTLTMTRDPCAAKHRRYLSRTSLACIDCSIITVPYRRPAEHAADTRDQEIKALRQQVEDQSAKLQEKAAQDEAWNELFAKLKDKNAQQRLRIADLEAENAQLLLRTASRPSRTSSPVQPFSIVTVPW